MYYSYTSYTRYSASNDMYIYRGTINDTCYSSKNNGTIATRYYNNNSTFHFIIGNFPTNVIKNKSNRGTTGVYNTSGTVTIQNTVTQRTSTRTYTTSTKNSRSTTRSTRTTATTTLYTTSTNTSTLISNGNFTSASFSMYFVHGTINDTWNETGQTTTIRTGIISNINVAYSSSKTERYQENEIRYTNYYSYYW